MLKLLISQAQHGLSRATEKQEKASCFSNAEGVGDTKGSWERPKLIEFTFYYPKEGGIFHEIHFSYK